MNDMIKQGILNLARKIGADPVDLASVISYETGGTFDPKKTGPTTKWGQHKGLFQWGEPQANRYGVDWSNPMSQFEAAAQYFTDAGYKPGMGLLDLYSAVNAGKVGRYNASDEAAGGAPGTVRDKVLNQFPEHIQKAKSLLEMAMGQGPTQGLGSNYDQEVAFAPPDQAQGVSFSPSQGPGEAQEAGLMDYARSNKDFFSEFGNAFAPPEQATQPTGPIISKRAEFNFEMPGRGSPQNDPISILRQLGLI
jgi:hypothetical protein